MNSNDTPTAIEMSLARVCEKLRQDALEPAKAAAITLEHEARQQAEAIRHKAQKEAEELLSQARLTIQKERQLFESSVEHAARQAIEQVKEKLEKELFLPHIIEWAHTSLQEAKGNFDLAKALVEAVKKGGLKGEIEVILPEKLQSAPLIAEFVEALKENSATLKFGQQIGGVQVRVEKQHLRLDLTDKVVIELLMTYLRKDFRKYLFADGK